LLEPPADVFSCVALVLFWKSWQKIEGRPFRMSLGKLIFKYLPRPIADRINAVPFARRIARSAFWVLVGGKKSYEKKVKNV